MERGSTAERREECLVGVVQERKGRACQYVALASFISCSFRVGLFLSDRDYLA